MVTVRMLPEFSRWLAGVRDGLTRRRLARRLERAQLGNMGDVKSVGEEVFEMREHFGAGWRMYYARRGDASIVMLGGGDKSTQMADIARAIHLASLLEN